MAAFGAIASAYTNVDVLDWVRTPTLVTGYQLEEFYPGQAATLYRDLPSTKAHVEFTVAEGSECHDSPQAPQRRNEVIFDWLEETLGVRG